MRFERQTQSAAERMPDTCPTVAGALRGDLSQDAWKRRQGKCVVLCVVCVCECVRVCIILCAYMQLYCFSRNYWHYLYIIYFAILSRKYERWTPSYCCAVSLSFHFLFYLIFIDMISSVFTWLQFTVDRPFFFVFVIAQYFALNHTHIFLCAKAILYRYIYINRIFCENALFCCCFWCRSILVCFLHVYSFINFLFAFVVVQQKVNRIKN